MFVKLFSTSSQSIFNSFSSEFPDNCTCMGTFKYVLFVEHFFISPNCPCHSTSTHRLFGHQPNERQSSSGSVGMVCSNCNYPDDGLRTCFLTGMTIRWKPVDDLPRLCTRMWYVFTYRPICPCNSTSTPRLFWHQANESKSLPGSVGMVCSNCTYPADRLRTCFLTGMTIRSKPVDDLPQLCSRIWYVFAYRPICPCNRLLASAGIRPTKAKACLVLLAWCVSIVTTLMMCYGLVSW